MKSLFLLFVAFSSTLSFASNDLELSQDDLPKEISSPTTVHKDTSLKVFKFMQVEFTATESRLHNQTYSERFTLTARDGTPTSIDLSNCLTMKYYLLTETNYSVGIQFTDGSGVWSDTVSLALSSGKGYREFPLEDVVSKNLSINLKQTTEIRIIVNRKKMAATSDFYIDELAFSYYVPVIEKPTGGWKRRQKKVKEKYQDQGLRQFNEERGRKARERAQ